MKGCIISYEPKDKDIFKKRIKPLKQNIKNILNFCDEVYIIAQCWSKETIETYKQDKVKIINFDKPLGVAEAKNYFLREYFYKSDDDYCYFSDDDSYFVDRYNIYELFDMFKNNDEEIRFIDILSPYPCNLQGYKEMNLEKQDLVEKNFTFICGGNILCTFFFKNFKKYYGKEFYFRDKIGDTPIHDDEDMIYRLIIEGFKRVQCEQFIANNSLNYTTLRNNSSDLLDIRKNTLENIIREYNLPLSTSYQKIKTKYLTYPKIIKRKTHYEFSDIEKTLKRKNNSIKSILDLVNKNNSFILGCENNKTLESLKNELENLGVYFVKCMFKTKFNDFIDGFIVIDKENNLYINNIKNKNILISKKENKFIFNDVETLGKPNFKILKDPKDPNNPKNINLSGSFIVLIDINTI